MKAGVCVCVCVCVCDWPRGGGPSCRIYLWPPHRLLYSTEDTHNLCVHPEPPTSEESWPHTHTHTRSDQQSHNHSSEIEKCCNSLSLPITHADGPLLVGVVDEQTQTLRVTVHGCRRTDRHRSSHLTSHISYNIFMNLQVWLCHTHIIKPKNWAFIQKDTIWVTRKAIKNTYYFDI